MMRGFARRGILGGGAPARDRLRRRPSAGSLLSIAVLCTFAACGGTGGSGVSPQIALVPRYDNLVAPVGITHAGDGTGNLYLVEQAGRIRLVRNGTLLAAPFLDISPRVLSGGERGLLGLAFPPGYATKRYFYVNYTSRPDGSTVIARYHVGADPDLADPASEDNVLTIPQPFANHNGGQLAFGPDGFLYVGVGDGGGSGDPFNNAQNPGSLLGKILRIDVESGAVPYAVPPTNPFVGIPGARAETWALGLRNPWRFSFDRQTGDLYIGDVGQSSSEEVDFQAAGSAGGQNYGWSLMEGSRCFSNPACTPAGLALPVAEYDHRQGCSITGGFVYRGQAHPRIQGLYLYADFCSGRFWGLGRDGGSWQNTLLLAEPHAISSFGEDEAGNLYASDLVAGVVHEIVAPN